MFAKFNEMIENEDNSKTDLLENLKELARTISIYDQMKVAGELRENLDDIQGPLKEEFYKVYAKYFVVRITEVRDNDDDFEGETFDFDEFVKSVVNLETNYNEPIEEDGKSSEEFKRIYTAISLYTTFVLDEPIHPVGTKFPGHLEVEYHDGVYYCPVKKNNEDNPRAVCQFCIAEQLEYD